MSRLTQLTLVASMGVLLSGCATQMTAPVEPVELKGTSWMLPIPKDSDCATNPILEFGEDSFSGDLGCNRAFGPYKIEGNVLTFGAVGVTRRMCAPDYMKLEDTMLNAINNVKTVAKTDKGLTFYDASGKELVTLVPEVAGACD
ncbi:MAG: META domain-containing protein [Sutterellaceae bacterium]|nr:META domain-containing protein [Sutterellaceae bacterium]